MRSAITLNSVSRSLSDVGLSPSHVGAASRRPFNVPAMMRMTYEWDQKRSSDRAHPMAISPKRVVQLSRASASTG